MSSTSCSALTARLSAWQHVVILGSSSGWAMYVLAFELLGSHVGAAIAAVAFTVGPFRTDFYLEFQMQLAFPIPPAVLGLLHFLETHRARYLISTGVNVLRDHRRS